MTPPPAEQLAARIFIGPALRTQPDRRLVDLVRDGYDAAFEEIVRRYRRPLDRFAAAIVGGSSEDVTQDAFSKALLALRGSEAEIELRPWLYRIVRNTALNDLRDREPATDELPAEGVPGRRGAEAEALAREELADLMRRLRALPEPQRAAIVMRELEGLGHEEIAAALGVSGGAARQAIFRARAALRDGLGLLVPLPLLRALAEQGGEASGGGAIAAGVGASSAGGAALGGLGGGALKVGMATVLLASAVGAGVAVEHHKGDAAGPQAAEAAPLAPGMRHRPGGARASTSGARSSSEHRSGSTRVSGGHGGDSENGSLGDGRRGGSDRSGSDSHRSAGSGGPGPSSGSGGGDHQGVTSGESGGGGGGSSGSGSDGGGDSLSGSSEGSSGEGGGSVDSGSGSGSGDGGESGATAEATGSGDGGGDSGSTSESSGETSGSGSGDLSGSGSDGSEVLP
jgi:RNA polymerase sigma factor (sigma-70 family)